MALRKIREIGDSCLKKKCREIEKFDERLHTLLDDMKETLLEANGVGLAAPQVGILRRVVVIDLGEDEGMLELINPVITHTEGSVTDIEGCLSVPGKAGEVERPQKATVKAYDRNGEEFEFTGEDLYARCICHECDHLDGILYVEKVSRFVDMEQGEEE
ncbi:MAG: peptide deformylase [Ruminococcaceae bacterium]|nr:peptide deformylase [Oscillospiraceae bacterium]